MSYFCSEEKFSKMRRIHKETPQQQTKLKLIRIKMDILPSRKVAMPIAPGSSKNTQHKYCQQTAGPEEVLTHRKNSLHTTEKQKVHLPAINRSTAPTRISERVGAGTAAKNPEKLRLLKRSQQLDLNRYSSFRTMMRQEKINEYAHSKNRLHAAEKEKCRLPPINITKTTPPLIILEEVEQTAKPRSRNQGTRKPRLLPKRQPTIGLSPFRALMHGEKENLEPVISTYTMNSLENFERLPFNNEKVMQFLTRNINSVIMSRGYAEDEGILAAPQSMHHHDDPLTSRVEFDFDLATSVLGVSAPYKESSPSDITSRRVQMTGRQECAWPVPSPPSCEKPKAPRGGARRATCVVKASSWPNNIEDGIVDRSRQKESEVKRSHSLSAMKRK